MTDVAPSARTLVLRVRNDSVASATGMWLFFGLGRGRIVSAVVVDLGTERIEGRIERNGVAFEWPDFLVPAGAFVTAHIMVVGEAPPWSGNVRWIGEGPEGLLLRPADLAPEAVGPPDDPKPYLRTPQELAARRRREIDGLCPGPIRDFHEFFFELDCATLSELFDDDTYLPSQHSEQRSRATRELAPLLEQRMMDRGRKTKAPWDPEPSVLSSRAFVHHVSVLMSSIIRRHFPHVDRGNMRSVERAFELFSCGRLGLHAEEWNLPLNGQPNGSNYFLFAEFAFTAAEMRIDQMLWERMQRVFVRTQEAFLLAYTPPKGSDLGLSSYPTDKPKPVTDASLRQLRESYAPLGSRDLIKHAAKNAKRAFGIEGQAAV